MAARVLVVDDIPANVRLLEAKLMAEYFDVITASDGPSAIEIVEKELPDIILLDIMMPGMDGYEVCNKLKQSPKTRHIPVVMVTALNDSEDRVRGLEVGADDFLTKPLNDLALFSRIRSLVRLKMVTDELRVRQKTHYSFNPIEQQEDDCIVSGKEADILLVEANDLVSRKVIAQLEEEGHRVAQVKTVAGALENGKNNSYDLMIIALEINGEDGLRLSSHFRANEETRHVPILLVIGEENLVQLAKGLDIGVTDYLTRPIDLNELRARCRTQVKRKRYHDKLSMILTQSVALAYTDSLTGVFNRRYMSAHLDRSIMEIAETAKPVSILLFDIDHFKSVNDAHGHPCGDEVLKKVAGRVKASMRDFDMLARYGGEEFVVVMPRSDNKQAMTVGERVRAAVSGRPFVIGSAEPLKLNITVSVGVATTKDPMEMATEVLSRADSALYKAKNNGRNQVVPAEISVEE